jgi:hypothetical protein
MSNICSECLEEVGDDEYLPDEDVCLMCQNFFLDEDVMRDDEFTESLRANSAVPEGVDIEQWEAEDTDDEHGDA